MVIEYLNLEPVKGISLELALNSRVSTGGWKGVERAGELGTQPLTHNQIEFILWCLGHTPHISQKSIMIEADGTKLDRKTLTLKGARISLEPVQYPRIKCPSIRLHWISDKNGMKTDTSKRVSFSTDIENAYWVEWGMGQEMIHVAGSIAKVGVNMIGGVFVDLVPMVPYLTSKPPEDYQKGNLPNPVRDSSHSAVQGIQEWRPSETFKPIQVSRSQLGQLLWAGCGCTPHKTFRYHRYGTRSCEGQGKTIPSASATYTTSLYVITQNGVFKYINWNKEDAVATHSLGQIRKMEPLKIGEYQEGTWVYTRTGDLIAELQQGVPRLPKATTYIVVTSNGRLPPYFALMEVGYSVLHIILQAQALGMASTIIITSLTQMKKIQRTIGLVEAPIAFIPIGATNDSVIV
jgi:hypothetical protein